MEKKLKFKDRLINAAHILARGTYVMPVKEYGGFSDIAALTTAGIQVNANSSLKLSAVWACVRLLSEQPASLPITVTRIKGGKREDLTGGTIHHLLHFPNKFMNSFSFIEIMNARLQLHGNSYAVIKFDRKGEPYELIPVDSNCVTVKVYNGEPFYVIDDRDMGIKGTFMYWEVIHFRMLSRNGITGLSPIAAAREAIGLGLAAEKFGADFFSKGGNLKGVLETESHLDDKVFKAWKDHWEKFYGGAVGDHTTPILEYGLKYKQLGIPPNDAQFIETRVFQLQDISRFFNVPPTFLADLSRSTFANGEQMDLQFVKYTLRPLVKREEVELESKLVNRSEEGTISIKHNMDGLLRADMKTRAAYEQTLVVSGIFTRNEAREIENKAPLEGLDVPLDPAFITGKKPLATTDPEKEPGKNKDDAED
jgi:HK97 family phage portal protein